MMKILLRSLLLFALLAPARTVAAKDPVENVIFFLDHRISIAVPEGFIYDSGRDSDGTITAQIADQKQSNRLQVQFQPDPSNQLGTERQQMDFLAATCRLYAEGSVERSFDFKPLAPRSGQGTYCSFTDASLVGHPPPKGEFRQVTTGVKVWPGWVIIFTLLSNEPASKEYQALLTLMKESFAEKAPPAPPKV